mmetsp:Transcript_53390/g.106216  ORF Transcript_53390/g.106216 Transcript_53390/m.106216 type:complete len:88 (-) Transcript_53390:26-289(-)
MMAKEMDVGIHVLLPVIVLHPTVRTTKKVPKNSAAYGATYSATSDHLIVNAASRPSAGRAVAGLWPATPHASCYGRRAKLGFIRFQS